MNLKIKYKLYCQRFLQILRNGGISSTSRVGFILRIKSGDEIIYSEVSPVSYHDGLETINNIRYFLKNFNSRLNIENNNQKFLEFFLPVTCTALSLILIKFKNRKIKEFCNGFNVSNTALLSAGIKSIYCIIRLKRLCFRCYKWKIGHSSFRREKYIMNGIIELLPKSALLRMDANGSLNYSTAQSWLSSTNSKFIEFIEQPLPIKNKQILFSLSETYSNQIALDESIRRLGLLKYFLKRKWSGLLIIKPYLLGDICDFLKWRFALRPDNLIYSSIFETSIGISILSEIIKSDIFTYNKFQGLGTINFLKKNLIFTQNLKLSYDSTLLRLSCVRFDSMWVYLSL